MIERYVPMSDGHDVFCCLLLPDREPIAHIHLLHGMAEHSGRYLAFMNELVQQGYAVSAHDHRGHGRTAEQNGYLGHFETSIDFDRIVDDVHEVVTVIQASLSPVKFVLFGHSMGSFIARRYVQRFGLTVDQLILSGTGADPGLARKAGQVLSTWFGKTIGYHRENKVLNELVFGAFRRSVRAYETDFDWLSTDRESVQAYIRDPYCGFIPTTNFFSVLFSGLQLIHNDDHVRQVPKNLPILLLSGGQDPVGQSGKGVWKVARQFVRLGVTNVTVKLYESSRHEPLQESNKEEVYEFIIDWMNETW